MRHAAQSRGYGNSSAHWADPVPDPSAGHVVSNNQSWANTQRETQSLLHQI
jgi:hypothetical protein